MPQYYKSNDAVEKQYYNSIAPTAATISLAEDSFFNDCFNCVVLGELLYDNNRAPLANAIARDIFSTSFSEIFDAFVDAGTIESYITVFKKIFGDDVIVAFTVPGNGQLNIAITATTFIIDDIIARVVENNSFVHYNLKTQAGDTLVGSSILGFTSTYDLEQMLFEMVPDGIYTQITLSIEE